MESIVALAGRRIDSAEPAIERFPARNAERVQTAISTELKRHHATTVVCSAAAGADLLAIMAAIKLGIDMRLVISPDIEEFAKMSVEDRGTYWSEQFKTAISAMPAEHIIRVSTQASSADTFRAINERILGEAIALASKTPSRQPICFAAWDGQPRGNEDFSADFVARAKALGLPIVTIDTR